MDTLEPVATVYHLKFQRGRRSLLMHYTTEKEALAAVETLKEFPGVSWVMLDRIDTLIEWHAEERAGGGSPVDMHDHCIKVMEG